MFSTIPKSRFLMFSMVYITLVIFVSIKAHAGNEKKKDANNVPLNQIYATDNGQEEIKYVDYGDKRYRHLLVEINKHAGRIGASNVFLVCGNDFPGAIKNTWEVFGQGYPVEKVVSRDYKMEAENIWLVVFMGIKGSGGAWQVKSVKQEGKSIRFSFFRGATQGAANENAYFYWVPLGKLEPGFYSLEIVDDKEREISFMRRVQIPNK
jgi:hypothetical protein